jgi:hypothetical protein
MEAAAPKLQHLPTSLHSGPYWKNDMSKSWLKIEICFVTLISKTEDWHMPNIGAYTHFFRYVPLIQMCQIQFELHVK